MDHLDPLCITLLEGEDERWGLVVMMTMLWFHL